MEKKSVITASLFQSIDPFSLKNVDTGSSDGSLRAKSTISPDTTPSYNAFYSYIKML